VSLFSVVNGDVCDSRAQEGSLCGSIPASHLFRVHHLIPDHILYSDFHHGLGVHSSHTTVGGRAQSGRSETKTKTGATRSKEKMIAVFVCLIVYILKKVRM